MEYRTIKDVLLINVFKGELLYLTMSGEIFLGELLIEENAEILAFLDSNEFLFFGKKGESLTFCKSILGESRTFSLNGFSPRFETLQEDRYLGLQYDLSDYSTQVAKYNIKERAIVKILFDNRDIKILFADNEIAVLKDNQKGPNEFTFYNHQTETTLWQFDSSELGIEKISKIMGVFGEVLVVFGHKNTAQESYLSSVPDLPIFFGISVANGSLLWQQDVVFMSGKNERDTHCRISLPFLNNETGKVIIFEAGQYIEMDALTGEICIWQNLHENPLSLNGLSMDPFFFDPCQVDESFIYFRTGIGESSRRAGVGVFDRKKQELVALEVLTDDSGNPVEMGPLKVQATKDEIYALDLKQTLHIFERE
ncbi:hypothetical protein [uncultured Arcticibacterium sp.]|uniref:hypothetical protein n=1 Tax=uncultured Arcticibacterium sp. TaxID=2173042 RepID=UPI0030FB3B46